MFGWSSSVSSFSSNGYIVILSDVFFPVDFSYIERKKQKQRLSQREQSEITHSHNGITKGNW